MTVPFGKENSALTFRVAGLTLVSGDEIPPEFNSLIPEDWKQTGDKQMKPEAQVKQGELK
jgi:hypothetical protein